MYLSFCLNKLKHIYLAYYNPRNTALMHSKQHTKQR